MFDFTPLRPREHAWAAPWHPPVILPKLSISFPRPARPGRSAFRADEGATKRGSRRRTVRVFL